MELVLRPLMPDDAAHARACVSAHLAGTRYLARALEQLDSALQFDDAEYMALLASIEDEMSLRGLVLFGAVAGAKAVVKVHYVHARELADAVALLEAVRAASERSGERLIVCELPDDEPFARVADALITAGYSEEGRVPDFIRDGIALRLLCVRPNAPG